MPGELQHTGTRTKGTPAGASPLLPLPSLPGWQALKAPSPWLSWRDTEHLRGGRGAGPAPEGQELRQAQRVSCSALLPHARLGGGEEGLAARCQVGTVRQLHRQGRPGDGSLILAGMEGSPHPSISSPTRGKGMDGGTARIPRSGLHTALTAPASCAPKGGCLLAQPG